MGNTRTLAFQVPEELFQRIKSYLLRNNMTQRQFILGLIEGELEREQTACEGVNDEQRDFAQQGEEVDEQDETAPVDDSEAASEGDAESEDESAGFLMGM